MNTEMEQLTCYNGLIQSDFSALLDACCIWVCNVSQIGRTLRLRGNGMHMLFWGFFGAADFFWLVFVLIGWVAGEREGWAVRLPAVVCRSSNTGPVPCSTGLVAHCECGAKIKIKKILGRGGPRPRKIFGIGCIWNFLSSPNWRTLLFRIHTKTALTYFITITIYLLSIQVRGNPHDLRFLESHPTGFYCVSRSKKMTDPQMLHWRALWKYIHKIIQSPFERKYS
jgi:hypothetical protein